MIITLSQAKKHLNIEDDRTDEDEYIMELIEVVESVIENDIKKTIVSVLDANGIAPTPLKQATKILIATFFENREATIVGLRMEKTPLSYEYLIAPYKKYTVG